MKPHRLLKKYCGFFSYSSKYLMLIPIVFFSFTCFAQQVISGTVLDHDSALNGVSVRVKGSNVATQTDNNGKYKITALPANTLVFSYVGYESQEVQVNNQLAINIVMISTSADIKDVVVIGYQTVRRKDLTGATSIINTGNSNKIIAASVGESIQGLTPGVTVRNGGAPGQNSVIEIRGVASFRNSDPLYVIDGMIADANSTINTDDIATIQILKDASAAAIYGSRAANGVIIITTKKGKPGITKLSVTARYGIAQLPTQWNVMDATGYLRTVNTEYSNSGSALPSGIADQLANNTVNTDWQNAIYRTGNTQDYNVGLSGGSQNGTYLVSGSYYKSQGVLTANDFERASLRINTEIHKGILTVGENIVLSNSNGGNPGGGINAFYEAPQMLPIIAVQSESYKSQQYNPSGWGFGTNEIPSFANNYLANAALDKQTYNFAKIVGNAYADLKFTSWLS